MFGFGKKEKKPLFIKTKDVFSIMKSDYDNGVAFDLIDFNLEGKTYTMGSVLIPDSKEKKENISRNKVDEIIDTALKGIGIAMGIAVTVLSVLGELEINAAFTMLGIGLAGISISLLKDKTSEK